MLVDDTWRTLEGVTLDNRAYASAQPRLGESHWDHFAKSENIMVCLNTAVVELDLGADGRCVEAIAIISRGQAMTLRPPRVALACGGLRTAQLLLATQRLWPNHFGGTGGTLGRNYMGHLTGWISSIRFNNLVDAAYFKPIAVAGAKFAQRRFTIERQVQLSEGLQNIALWAGARAFYDPTHTSGLLSAVYLALALPGIGPLLLPKPLRRAALGPKPRNYMPHVQNVARAPLQTAWSAIGAVSGKMRVQQAIGELLQQDGSLEYLLTYHAEAAPRRESRVTLGEKTDSFGLPRMRIDLRFSDTGIASIVRAHEILDRALRKAGKARLKYLDAPEGRASRVLEQATDGYHQLGLTRMGTDPRQSIVDQNCRVHGLENLFITSGSVFPTSGRANPTLLTVALAFRLADHVAMSMRAEIISS
jgi:hypothetical protein